MREIDKLGPDATASEIEAATYLSMYDIGREHAARHLPDDPTGAGA